MESDVASWIVLGDIHLHASSDPRVAQDLQALVRDVTRRHPDAWIVFNGDTFDLDRVRGEPRGGVGAQLAASRLDRILVSQPALVEALRCHGSRGGRLLFVAGNHDAELLLAPVRALLIERLGGSGCVEVLESLQWGNRVVEHGHQADPDAAFHPDPTTALAKNRLSAYPLASLITRALLSYIPRFELAGDNHEPPLKVLLRVLRDYKFGAIQMIARFPLAGIRILWHASLARIRGDVCTSCEASMSSPFRVARRLYLDRYFGAAFGVPLAVGLAAGWVPPWLVWPVGFTAVALAIPPSRRKQFAHRDVKVCSRLAAEHVARGARLVVLGHIHRAFVEEVEGGAVYANHGAFSMVDEGRTYLRIDSEGACSLETMPVEGSFERPT
jgi:UDP-2,3-diacylglucosamine pyrophosphatase LpxH